MKTELTQTDDQATPKGPVYWRSLDELADTPQFREFVAKEFPSYSPTTMLQSNRRQFLKIMGASVALAGLTGCRRWPKRKLAPYAERPAGQIPGDAEHFATSFELDGVAQPLLVTAYDGRPVKIEGNPDHPASGGAASLKAQASILDLYDPARSRSVLKDGEKSDFGAFDKWANAHFAELRASKGQGLTILAEPSSSPTQKRLRDEIRKAMPNADWFDWHPTQASGDDVRPVYHLAEAEVIVSLGADFMMTHPDHLRMVRDYAAGRKKIDTEHKMNRLYVAESTMSVTGSNADERLALPAWKIEALARSIASDLGVAGVNGTLPADLREHALNVAGDLKRAGKHAVVMVGDDQPEQVKKLAAMINRHLKADGTTVKYVKTDTGAQRLTELPAYTKTLVMLGTNIDYAASFDVPDNVTTVHLGFGADETAINANWHVPGAHYLEVWGDARVWDGTASLVQPLIMPLFDGRSSLEMLQQVLGEKMDSYEAVRATWLDKLGERGWRKALHDGMVADSAYPAAPSPRGSYTAGDNGYDGFEVTFRQDYKVGDGRFANNGWLQELPDPITRLVWDNAAYLSMLDCETLGVKLGDVISITLGDTTVEVPVYPLPGQANGSIALTLGYGRTAAGPVGDQIGTDLYPLLHASIKHQTTAVKVAAAKADYTLVTTQDHHAIDSVGAAMREKRAQALIRTTTVEGYKDHPDFVHGHDYVHPIKLPQYGSKKDPDAKKDEHSHDDHKKEHKVYYGSKPPEGFSEARGPQPFVNPLDEFASEDHQWGMTVDLNSCIGCNACVIACQAENNIPIVGKSQVKMNREMHWLRVDRYFSGDVNDPSSIRAAHQPMACVHCETAPCEQVCPVAATVHDAEGLNTMVYNRCIGTRYCANNCPYKVRRFNYFDWNARDPRNDGNTPPFLGIPDQQQQKEVGPVERMRFNPEVTVRMRGVMEKCTYCTQRIESARHTAKAEFGQGKRDTDVIQDGEVQTACQQTCSTGAIHFGNLKDPNSKVAKIQKENERAYTLLDHLNVRPRTMYLAKITNPLHDDGSAHDGGAH